MVTKLKKSKQSHMKDIQIYVKTRSHFRFFRDNSHNKDSKS